MKQSISRRTLTAAGGGALLSAIGMSALTSGESNSDSDATTSDEQPLSSREPDQSADEDAASEPESDAVSETALTTIVEPDESEIEALVAKVESGELPQAEVEDAAMELIEETKTTFETTVDDHDTLEIEARAEELEEAGMYLIDGSERALLELLYEDKVTVLAPAQFYDQLLESAAAAGQQPQQPPQQQQPQQPPPQQQPEQPPQQQPP